MNNFHELLTKVTNSHELNQAEIMTLLSVDSDNEVQALCSAANEVRQRFLGDEVHLRGLIEFSNYCRQDCHYCGLRRSNKQAVRYRLTLDEIREAAEFAAAHGYRTIVLQSGEDAYFTAEVLANIVKMIKSIGDFAITISVGLRTDDEYKLLKAAGADRFLMKHETSDSTLFEQLRPGTKLQERLTALQSLKAAGWQIGSGFMVGLPGQTMEAIAKDILLLKELQVDMAGIGPFLSHNETPLANEASGDLKLTLKAIAIARLLMPTVHMPATSAIGTLHPEGQRLALNCGANVVMPNLSPTASRKFYQIYPGKVGSTENAAASHERVAKMLKEIGRPIATGRGDSMRG